MKQRTTQKGFTIIELMFATVIFSLILLLSLAALVQIGKLYYKGITTAQTQETARNIMDELSQSIQLSSSAINFPTGQPTGPEILAISNATGYFCVGDTRYSYAIDRELTDSSPNASSKEIYHVLWADTVSRCADQIGLMPLTLTNANPGGTNGHELAGAHMRIFKIAITNPVSNVWKIELSLAYGDDDLFTLDDPTTPTRKFCKTADAGTQFCATSDLSTYVSRRLL